ncbi:hypothetical protein BDV41DRAFT_589031 [Aspergillus transmontanensis]|uniref:Major facilitator superfamily domain-containing protein n=1 Tax=Aspergillus transmontanensis TaxID=1034304 RepID=A0A5N6VV40_9EURO|nr:hypothetical protein BDV41DRAFT_589031 [Aspergillus transmontanensis]
MTLCITSVRACLRAVAECSDGISITTSATQTMCRCLGKKKPLSFFLAFLCLLLMVFLVSLDATTLAVAIPAITSELSGTTLTAFWANISLTLAVVVIQPIYTSVSDIIGLSIAFSVAKSMAVIILGALLSEYVDWRWIGWINLPVIAVAVVLAILFMRLKPIGKPFREQILFLDRLGIILFLVGCTICSLPLSWAGTIFIHGMVLCTLLQYLPLFFLAIYLDSPLKSSVSILPFCVVLMAFTGIAAMQASTPSAEDQGLAMGIMVSFRLFGALIGLVIGATTFSSVYENSMASIGPLPEALALLKNPNEAVSFIP